MSHKQNPAAKDRVLWNSLVGASTELDTPSERGAQCLICTSGANPEVVKACAGFLAPEAKDLPLGSGPHRSDKDAAPLCPTEGRSSVQ